MSDLLNSASLVMIPSGYKEDVVYSQIPTDGSGDLSFTRASNGTRINSAGLVEVCPWNFIEYSEQFTSAAWATSNGATVSADQTTAPNGTTTADKIVFPANSAANIYNFPTSPVGSNNISVYAKTLSGTKQFRLRIDTGSGPAVSSNFTATTEWQRFDFAVTTTAANLVAYIFNDSTGVAGDLYVWGAQLNIGSTAKPYFPTTDRLNVPRLTYQNGGGGCPSLLLEKQSTNLVTYSEDFTNSAWTKLDSGSGSTTPVVTANYATSPDGTQNADRLQCTLGSSGYSLIQQQIIASGTHTGSIWVKSNTGANQNIYFRVSTNTTAYVVTPEWQRITLTESAGDYLTIGLRDQTGYTNYSCDILIWGAQLEASSYATSYIPTTSSSATRVADACFKTGISSLIGQTEGVLFADFNFAKRGTTANDSWLIESVVNDSDVGILIYAPNENTIYCYINNGLASGFQLYGSVNLTQRFKVAIAYKSGDYALIANGAVLATNSTSYAVPTTMNQIGFGKWVGISNEQVQSLNQSVIFKTRLSNAELIALTTI